jgi:hypothetical protein
MELQKNDKKYIIFNYNDMKIIGTFTKNVSVEHIKNMLRYKIYKITNEIVKNISLIIFTGEDIRDNTNINTIFEKFNLDEYYKFNCKIPQNLQKNIIKCKIDILKPYNQNVPSDIIKRNQIDLHPTDKSIIINHLLTQKKDHLILIKTNAYFDDEKTKYITHKLDINLNFTVNHIKYMMEYLYGLKLNMHILTYTHEDKNIYIYDNDIISNFYDKNIIFKFIYDRPFDIYIKTLTGKNILCNVNFSDTVLNIKKYIRNKEGINQDDQRLVYNGKQLDDDTYIHDYNIKEGTCIYLILTLRGGMFIDITSGNIDLNNMEDENIDIDFDVDFHD